MPCFILHFWCNLPSVLTTWIANRWDAYNLHPPFTQQCRGPGSDPPLVLLPEVACEGDEQHGTEGPHPSAHLQPEVNSLAGPGLLLRQQHARGAQPGLVPHVVRVLADGEKGQRVTGQQTQKTGNGQIGNLRYFSTFLFCAAIVFKFTLLSSRHPCYNIHAVLNWISSRMCKKEIQYCALEALEAEEGTIRYMAYGTWTPPLHAPSISW